VHKELGWKTSKEETTWGLCHRWEGHIEMTLREMEYEIKV